MAMPRVEELINLLVDGTMGGQLKWQATVDEDTFRLTSPSANVRLTRSDSFTEGVNGSFPEPNVLRRLSVLNSTGRIVAEYHPENEENTAKFDSLFEQARWSAHNTDQVIERLMKELQQKTA